MTKILVETKTMACDRKITYKMGYTSFSCTGYPDNRHNCQACPTLHKFPVYGDKNENP